jgi:hypothetical protein
VGVAPALPYIRSEHTLDAQTLPMGGTLMYRGCHVSKAQGGTVSEPL